MLLLIHPPVAKPGEPPEGPAGLAHALKSRGVACRVWDANLEGLLDLLEQPAGASDTWSRRAAAGLRENLAALRTPRTCSSFERYKQAVLDINRLLYEILCARPCARLSWRALSGQSGWISPLYAAAA